DVAYDAIMGSTDSEHIFGLLLNYIQDPFGEVSCEELVEAMWAMLQELSALLVEAGVREHSYLNLCVTNGTSIVATRYTTNPNTQPATLYYIYGRRYYCNGDWCGMEPTYGHPSAVVLASEPLTGTHSDWIKIERNTMMVVDETLRLQFHSIELPFEGFVTEEVEVS
ncbi:MAG: class II glutamine amidotransferase, partial [Candidatus Kapabacteria bacterium]|nr:class II glutamine amidotransferase [Candidatus Kapabacteria bacterium]